MTRTVEEFKESFDTKMALFDARQEVARLTALVEVWRPVLRFAQAWRVAMRGGAKADDIHVQRSDADLCVALDALPEEHKP